MDFVTQITAIIGCITGVVSLAISLTQFVLSRPKLVFRFHLPHLTGITDNPNPAYTCNKLLIIPVSIENNSPSPVVISSASVICKKHIMRPVSTRMPVLTFDSPAAPIQYWLPSPCISYPYSVESGSCEKLLMVFAAADPIYSAHSTDSFRVWLRLRVGGHLVYRLISAAPLAPSSIEAYKRKHERKLRNLE